MGHWKRLIKIPSGTDWYYCIKNRPCLIHVFYCIVVLVTVPDHLSAIMLQVHFVTLPSTCYTFCDGILLMYMYTLHCIYSVFCIPCRHHVCLCTTPYYVYIASAHLHVHFYHVTTSMFISITSPQDNIIYYIKLDMTIDMTR